MSSVPDPQFEKRLQCTKCPSQMGPVRVHEGSNDKPDYQGRITQTCLNKRCHYTIYHTTDAYLSIDAEALIERASLRLAGSPIPDRLNVPLRLAPAGIAPESDSGGKIHCQNSSCMTASGTRTRASVQCLEFLCKTCCNAAHDTAQASRLPRNACKNHRLPAVSDHDYVRRATPVQPPPGAASRGARTPAAAAAPRGARAPAAVGTSHTPTRRQPLTQPIGPLWGQNHATAQETKTAVQDLKSRRLEMDEQEKRTVKLMFWLKAGSNRIAMPQYIPTYPRLQLGDLTGLVDELQLDAKSRFDHWNGHTWDTISISSIIHVESDYPTLLKLRPSLLTELSLVDCPGLGDELARHSHSSPKKRPLDLDASSSPSKRGKGGENHVSAAPVVPAASGAASTSASVSIPIPEPRANPVLPAPSVVAVFSAHRSTSHPGSSDVIPTPSSTATAKSGWQEIRELQDTDPEYKSEAAAFPKVFGYRYAKSTVHKYKSSWDSTAGKLLRNKFVGMGDVPGASWAHLLAAIRNYKPGDEVVDDGALPTISPDVPSRTATTSPSQSTPPASLHLLPPSTPPALLQTMPMPPASSGPEATGTVLHPSQSLRDPQGLLPPPPLDPFDWNIDLNFQPMDVDFIDNMDPMLELCCFCDEPYFVQPSTALLQMRAGFEEQVIPCPMAQNASHCCAPEALVQPYCERHRAEGAQLPIARSKGWPVEIVYGDLQGRIEAHEEDLLAIAEDPTASTFFEAALRRRATDEPFSQLVGYFGTSGYREIATAVEQVVQFARLDAQVYAPLSVQELLREVLIPEAQILLICDDLNQTNDVAASTLHDSSPFGLVFHSDLAFDTPLAPTDTMASTTLPEAKGPPQAPPSSSPPATTTALPYLSPLYNLPSLPSLPPISLLMRRIELESISSLDPLAENPGHHRPPSYAVVQGYCEMHRVELTAYPQAKAEGWLMDPDFGQLFERVIAFGRALRDILDEPENSAFFRSSREHYTSHPQSTSLMSQFASSDRLSHHGAAYYGEIGHELFTIAVRYMFPDSEDVWGPFAPLSYAVVLREVLVPEAVTRIVQADLKITARSAKAVISHSYRFGLVRHPASTDSPAIEAAICYTMQNDQASIPSLACIRIDARTG
ncbi:hypothetical protein B0H14DRAFT_3164113 [Mycena olivaceomarginata]|nr:hypothetical protein B0H14DRAFT_3164113 [Mycena olivaceomarginata]